MKRKIKHLFINFSATQAFDACPRKFWLEWVERQVPKTAVDESLSAKFKGTLIHRALDLRAQGLDPMIAFQELDGGLQIVDIEPNASGSLDHYKAVIKAYQSHYANDNLTYLATERTLQMPLDDDITLCGTIDKQVLINGAQPAIVDHKTSSSFRTFIAPTIPLSDQFTGYMALAAANGFETDTLIVDGISTAMNSLKRWEWLRDNPDEDQMPRGIGGAQPLFTRIETMRTPEQLDNYTIRMRGKAREIKAFIESNERFSEKLVMPQKDCNAYGSRCPFIDACINQSDNVISFNFRPSEEPRNNFNVVWED